jgi:hypothetical protein
LIVYDAVLWVAVLVFAVLFFLLALGQDNAINLESGNTTNYMMFMVRRPILAVVSALFWSVWSGMSYSINNCDFTFGSCFTTITEATTTTVIHANNFSQALGFLGFGMFLLSLVVAIIQVVFTAYDIIAYGSLIAGRKGQ